MEGVGARLGRSSTRYGPATVFTGPVRKWKKKWIHVTPPITAASSNNKHHHHHHLQANGYSSSNGNNNNASHLLLYKWTPISQSHSTSANDNSNGDAKDDGGVDEVEEEPPRRKMKYIPVAVLEEQHNEDAAGTQTDEPKTVADPPDINDVPIQENQVCEEENGVERQDLNKSSSGLSLNLNDEDSEEAKDQTNDD